MSAPEGVRKSQVRHMKEPQALGRESTYYIASAGVSDPFRRLAALTGLLAASLLHDLIDGRGQAVAEVGFHGPPDDDGWVEIGYRVVTGYRRRGLAEEACRGLLDWAFTQGVDGVRAAISPDNEASARLAQKLGFAHAGRARHEVLGEQLIFEHPRGSYGCLG